MAKRKVKELKVKDKIQVDGEICTITKIEKSDIGKQGKIKYRVESINEKKEQKVIVRSADDSVDVF